MSKYLEVKLPSFQEMKLGYVEIKKHKGDNECDVIIHKEQKK